MTLSNMINLISAAFGLLGAIALYKGSFAYEQGGFYDDENFSITKAMNIRNRRRQWQQRMGLALIAFGLSLQAAVQFI